MKLNKKEKAEKSKSLGSEIKKAAQVYFTDFKGLKFGEIDDLRGKLRPLKGHYAVVKNSLLRYAFKEAGVDGATPQIFKGPIGIVVCEGTDPVASAKILATFAKQFPNLKIKAGFVDKKWLKSEDCLKLSTLSSKPELLSQLVGTLQGLIAQSASVLQAPIRDFALILAALLEKRKEAGTAA
jgi:large subunit ribosomal protein L10